jgi:hypothetical protein
MLYEGIPQKANRLINEKSPYLLQHAYNPVDWYTWCDEAFEEAKRQEKPVFLSIGYSTCHWCHVMAKESFEDEEVADVLNEYFICIKVDREERPDIDQIYMNFSQMSTGQGGWPLNVFLTPDRNPFYAVTYLPKTSHRNHPGLIDVLMGIQSQWEKKPEDLRESAERMAALLNALDKRVSKEKLKKSVFDDAYAYLEENFDPQYGGFGSAPKFPTPHFLFYLLRYHQAFREPYALEMVEKTLQQMYKGGIFDHLGFGFSRYSTDEKWLVPHFEKMLYDNALLIMVYIETYQVTGKALYKKIAEKTIGYVIRDLRSQIGGFYCAEDADSEGEEGKFYVWQMGKVEKILGKNRAELFFRYYPMSLEGNFEGRNIPNLLTTSLDEIEKYPELEKVLEEMRVDLFEQREKRIHPHKDDKILTAWNGLMIVALAMAGRVFQQPILIELAEQTMAFIEKNMTRSDGRLYARYRQGEAKHLGYLDDYANTLWAYLELYQSTFKIEHLEKAIKRSLEMISLFGGEACGAAGFELYGKDAEKLITNPKELFDNTQPSGNAVAAYCLIKLGKITGKNQSIEIADKMFEHFAHKINTAPMACPMMLCAKMLKEQPTTEVLFVGDIKNPVMAQMNNRLNRKFLPFSVVVSNKGSNDLERVNEFVVNQKMIDEKPTVYICKNYKCEQPVTSLEEFTRIIEA